MAEMNAASWRRLAMHGLCFAMPVTTLVYLSTAPHPWWIALPAAFLLVGAVVLDMNAGPERTPPDEALPAWPFHLALYVLTALQVINVALLVKLGVTSGLGSLDTWVGIWLGGASSGYSAIVVAHELIHRPKKRDQRLARLLMSTVLYEHFCTEHIRGHHRRIGTDEDPATARFGETFWQFLPRTVVGQFRSALSLDRRQVVQGLVFEWGVVAAIGLALGPAAFAVYVLQAAWAVLLLEAVNYIEHWGLRRQARRVGNLDSWDAESWFTYYTLVGLSRHADHHAVASRPYQSLRYFEESPKMKYGYWGMVILSIFHNAHVRELMVAELQARGLGPYQEGATYADLQRGALPAK